MSSRSVRTPPPQYTHTDHQHVRLSSGFHASPHTDSHLPTGEQVDTLTNIHVHLHTPKSIQSLPGLIIVPNLLSFLLSLWPQTEHMRGFCEHNLPQLYAFNALLHACDDTWASFQSVSPRSNTKANTQSYVPILFRAKVFKVVCQDTDRKTEF